ncbi:MAG TPA: hypothetical protein PKC19_10855, partial [Roseiflexaceae bacterium]|nr:hypothetical protein [Roseiflexaceae bacterium]
TLFLMALIIGGLLPIPAQAQPKPLEPDAPVPPGSGRLLFVASRGTANAIDIFSSDLAGEQVVNLTNHAGPDRSPSWSPDGREIVFASRREANWDLYLMNADGSDLRRLTNHPAYDGEPAWSPDGRRIAFTSNRDGSLDLYLLTIADGSIMRLTSDSAVNAQPAWSPDGTSIVFMSWRDENQEIYRLRLDSWLGQAPGMPENLSSHPAPDHSPAWSPDGTKIAFISDRDGIGNLHVLDLNTGLIQQAGPLNRGLADPAWTPSGSLVAVGPWSTSGRGFASRYGVLVTSPGSSAGVFIAASAHGYAEPAWHANARTPAAAPAAQVAGRLPPIPAPAPDLAQITPGFAALGDVRSGGQPRLAAAVAPSFAALRQAVITESGHDFLARLSEASRAVEFYSGTSSYTSWHKAGRAFDTLFDYQQGGRQVLYISPEWRAGRLFWRLYLRAARQDGTQGAPIAAAVFDTASRRLLPPPAGFFVDFTALAAEYGWGRIAAQGRETFHWRSEPLALEYWHFERRDGLTWYEAMRQVYDEQTLARVFSEERMLAAGVRPENLPRYGLPWLPQAPAPAPVLVIDPLNAGRPW